ncbi:hypothetical protein B9Z55_000292 [Caenorhabditis nigoni]|uniref:Uncharacterized protein n=1 Tax=Caenorhabditis nigoni TaxID=1611254 RepID=A0A2G5VN98_9PELO|nr:hypothetical protein B9Z55_000292 [Caenorhabditis nigoni]
MPQMQAISPNILKEPGVSRILYINVAAGNYSRKQRGVVREKLFKEIIKKWLSDHTRTAYLFYKRHDRTTYANLEIEVQEAINLIPNRLKCGRAEFEVNHADVKFIIFEPMRSGVVEVDRAVQADGNDDPAVQNEGNEEPVVENGGGGGPEVENEGNELPVVENEAEERPAVGNEDNERQAVENEGNEQPVVGNEVPTDRDVKPEGLTVKDVKIEEPMFGNDGTEEPTARDVETEEPSTSDVKTEEVAAGINKLEIKKEENNEGEQEANFSH